MQKYKKKLNPKQSLNKLAVAHLNKTQQQAL
ncbi:MAG: class I lanthipeptide [Bacteroidales bacterium]|nr:class I lanthipeptide [Bacteroidales bacterium]